MPTDTRNVWCLQILVPTAFVKLASQAKRSKPVILRSSFVSFSSVATSSILPPPPNGNVVVDSVVQEPWTFIIASEVTTLWRDRNVCIIITGIITSWHSFSLDSYMSC